MAQELDMAATSGAVSDLQALPLRSASGGFHVVIGSCRGPGAGGRLRAPGAAAASSRARRALQPLNPGFMPSTLAADGDPLDVLVLGDFPLQAGIVVDCRVIGMVRIARAARGRRGGRPDHRIIATCDDGSSVSSLPSARSLPARLRTDIERFASSQIQTGHRARIVGWSGPRAALRHLAASGRAYQDAHGGACAGMMIATVPKRIATVRKSGGPEVR
jgi:inorganic pyrophosphatase